MTTSAFGGDPSVLGRLVMSIRGDLTDYNRDLGKARKRAEDFQKWSRRAAIGAGLFAAASAGAVAFGDKFARVDRQIRAATGAQGEELRRLRKDFDEVYRRVPTDAAIAADVLAAVNARLGLQGEELQNATANALVWQRVMGVDAKTAVTDAAGAMEIFNIDAAEMAGFMDQLLVVSQAYGVNVGRLTSDLRVYGPVLKNAGFNAHETAEFMAQMNRSGIDLTRVMPGLNAFFRRAAEEGEDMQVSFFNAITQIQRATNDTGALALATEYFGAEGAQRMTTFIRNEGVELNTLEVELEGATGKTRELGDTTLTTMERFQLWKQNIEAFLGPMAALGSSIGAVTLPLTSLATVFLLAGSTSVGAAIGARIYAASLLLLRASGVAALTSTILLYAWWGLAHVRLIALAVGARIAAAGMIALNAAMIGGRIALATFGVVAAIATGPIGLVAVAVIALAAAGFLLWKNWETVSNGIKDIWNKIPLWIKIGAAIALLVLAPFIGIPLIIWRNWDKIEWFFRLLWDSIPKIFQRGLDKVQYILQNMGAIIGGLVTSIINSITKAINYVIRAINSISFTMPSFTIPNPFGDDITVGGFTFRMPQIPELRTDFDPFGTGGIGAQIQRMNQELYRYEGGIGTPLHPDRMMGLGGGQGGDTYNFYGDNYGFEDFSDKVGEANLFNERRGLGREG